MKNHRKSKRFSEFYLSLWTKIIINRKFSIFVRRINISIKKKPLLEIGYFDKLDFIRLIQTNTSKKGASIQVCHALLDTLINWMLVTDSTIGMKIEYAPYRWHYDRIKFFLEHDIADNLLLGPSYVAEKYRKSVPAIIIEKTGVNHVGTAFLCGLNQTDSLSFLVTAKHNIDPDEGIKFKEFITHDGEVFQTSQSDWILHPKLDLAIIPTTYKGDATKIYPFGKPRILSKTITFGYPRVSTADAPYLLSHSGEINAPIRTYFNEELLIISNNVGAGNSGGPVLDEAGLCVGMVIKSLESNIYHGSTMFNAAIPANSIYNFLKTWSDRA